MKKIVVRSFINKVKQQKVFLLFLLPGVLAFVLFTYLPMMGLLMAFQKYSPFKGFFKSPFVGFDMFIKIFNYPDFMTALKNTLVISTMKLIVCFPAPIIFALLLNDIGRKNFKKTVQTISYLPYFISWVVAAGLWYKLLSVDGGVVNELLMKTNIIQVPYAFLQSRGWFYVIVLLTELWKSMGFNAIIYLAALASIDVEQYEAAIMDGAHRLQRMWYISLPGIKGTIILLFILTVSNLLNAGFDQMQTMMNLAVKDVADIIDTLVLRTLQMQSSMDSYSLGAAMGFFKSTVGLLLFIIVNEISKRTMNESLI